jgi:hypothetical protein
VRERRRTEDRAAALPLITDDTTHPEVLTLKMYVRLNLGSWTFGVQSIPLCGLTRMGLVTLNLRSSTRSSSLFPSADHAYALVGIFDFGLR